MEHYRGVTTLHPWGKGMNNLAQDRMLPEETVRNAVNVDFHSSGDITSRKKPTRVYSGFPKNGYSCPLGMFFVENLTVKKYGTTPTSIQVVAGPVCYHYLNGILYFSDGVSSWKYDGTTISSWGMSVPSAPVMSRVSGAYGAGTYLAAVCWVDADGVESGASAVTAITVGDDSGFVFNNLPQG